MQCRLLEALRIGLSVVVLRIHHVFVSQILVVRIEQIVVPLFNLIQNVFGLVGSQSRIHRVGCSPQSRDRFVKRIALNNLMASYELRVARNIGGQFRLFFGALRRNQRIQRRNDGLVRWVTARFEIIVTA